MVFIVTQNSISSHYCQWELAETKEYSKRLIPIVREAIPPEKLPPQIAEINLLPFTPDLDATDCVSKLVKAIFQDQAWIREHSRIGTLAADWEESQKNEDRLLRGKALASAERWASQRPFNAPEPSRNQLEFITSSQIATKRRSRRLMAILISVTIGTATLAGVAEWQRRSATAAAHDAIAQRVLNEAEQNFSGTNQPVTGLQNIFMTLAGNQLAQKSNRSFIHTTGHTSIQREYWRQRALLWTQETESAVTSVAFSPDGDSIISGEENGKLILWSSQSGTALEKEISREHYSQIIGIAFGKSGETVISGEMNGAIIVWDIKSKKVKQNYSAECWLRTFAVSRDGRIAVHCGETNELKIWDTNSSPKWDSFGIDYSEIRSLVFTSDGRFLASAGDRSVPTLWNMSNGGSPLLLKTKVYFKPINSLAFSSDNQLIASGSDDGFIQIWAIGGEGSLTPLGDPLETTDATITSVAFSPDGKYIASGSADKTIQLWDAHTRENLDRPLKGHTGVITSIAFSPDSKQIISGSQDKTIRLWTVSPPEFPGKRLTGHKDAVTSIAFGPDT